MDDDKRVEIWLRMYEEQIRHGRHHEMLRAQSSNIIIVITAAIFAFLSQVDDISSITIFISGSLVLIFNIFGLLMGLKHYERSRLHVTVAAQYRNVVSGKTKFDDFSLNQARKLGRDNHVKRSWVIRRIRAYHLWVGLHVVLTIVGVALLLTSFGHGAIVFSTGI